MAEWTDNLTVATYRGFPLDVLSVSDTQNRRVVEHTFPYKDGADLEDTGRSPRPFRIEAIFFGDGYLTDLREFLILADEGVSGPLVHPLLGTYDFVKVLNVEITHVSNRRDSATVSIEFREDGTNLTLPDFGGAEAAADEMETEAALAQSLADDIDASLPEVNNVIADAKAFFDDIADTIDDLNNRLEQLIKAHDDAVAEIQAYVDAANAAVAEARRIGDVVTQNLRDSLGRLVQNGRKIKERTEKIKPKIVQRNVPVSAPTSSIALKLYGDPERDEDIIRVNKIRNPFLIPPGTELKVFTT